MLAVIDNYDSFTWNLVQILGELGEEPRVFRNDAVTPEELRRLGTGRLVVSPGPCTPAEAGISVEAIRELGPSTPTLGVCLGHQSIAAAYGGRTVRATRAVHGKVSSIRHNGDPLFDGISSPMLVTRYHSLIASAPLPRELEPVAWSTDPADAGEIQALRHRQHPVWGVQFHPESWFTEGGRRLLENFLGLAVRD
ncbi:MAG: aminodeoxychorismate/anthranilate synthase component II [Gemmatimonadetes bacterium]|nr:aminodeoxychorismate/anthranilate synthase component II [Gemmatimonadota bacterium]MYA65487.1 aminodeoxychorismate/anthranilate synthase component II [Gemmatimonadota bacterium]MYB99859.1 aminodeoxychorismate/anthranilate synthase component II [Gemmatimonadota bacterium]MYH52964.1 aminodeoxychorismate/anthranilate synthase component II [Gemmatimonadota bacterium]MYI45615.1 aminodeoxychorismate/anthranilate synthase component II [Gemmatimonadota bacterium]